MLTGQGTAREQWAEAGIEVTLGRMTAAELHALGVRMLAVRREEREEVRDKIDRYYRMYERAEERCSVAEEDLATAEKKLGKAVLEIEQLKKRITELEAKQR